jgi:hypothetical protein
VSHSPICSVLGRKFLTDEWLRYKKLAERVRLSSMPDWQWCQSPKCDEGQVHPKSKGPRFSCRSCGYRACLKHGGRWHHGQTCEERDHQDKRKDSAKILHEEASERWKATNSKRCAGCGVTVWKDGGCNHMYCESPSFNPQQCDV